MEIKYANMINDFDLKLTALELDVFFYFVGNIDRSGGFEIEFGKLKKDINFRHMAMYDFERVLDSILAKLAKVTFCDRTEKRIVHFTMFSYLGIDPETSIVFGKVNDDFKSIIDVLENNFTLVSLQQLTSIKGKYNKRLFLCFRQFASTGVYRVKIFDFRRRLSIPESYQVRDINQKIVEPAMDELKKVYKHVSVEYIINHNLPGNPLKSYVFRFDPDERKTKGTA